MDAAWRDAVAGDLARIVELAEQLHAALRTERGGALWAATVAAAPPTAAASTRAASNGAATLAIPGYDALSASQVVDRLMGLERSELDAVREYEVSHRNRRTILGKIDQLSAG